MNDYSSAVQAVKRLTPSEKLQFMHWYLGIHLPNEEPKLPIKARSKLIELVVKLYRGNVMAEYVRRSCEYQERIIEKQDAGLDLTWEDIKWARRQLMILDTIECDWDEKFLQQHRNRVAAWSQRLNEAKRDLREEIDYQLLSEEKLWEFLKKFIDERPDQCRQIQALLPEESKD